MKSAYTELLKYLEDYDVLDVEKLPEVKKRIQIVDAKILNLNNLLLVIIIVYIYFCL